MPSPGYSSATQGLDCSFVGGARTQRVSVGSAGRSGRSGKSLKGRARSGSRLCRRHPNADHTKSISGEGQPPALKGEARERRVC